MGRIFVSRYSVGGPKALREEDCNPVPDRQCREALSGARQGEHVTLSPRRLTWRVRPAAAWRVLWMAWLLCGWAAGAAWASADAGRQRLATGWAVLMDPGETLSPDQLADADVSSRLRTLPGAPSLGYVRGAAWLRLTLPPGGEHRKFKRPPQARHHRLIQGLAGLAHPSRPDKAPRGSARRVASSFAQSRARVHSGPAAACRPRGGGTLSAHHRRQNEGVSSTSTDNGSSRPRSMASVKTCPR